MAKWIVLFLAPCLLLSGCGTWETTEGGFVRYDNETVASAVAKTFANIGVGLFWATYATLYVVGQCACAVGQIHIH